MSAGQGSAAGRGSERSTRTSAALGLGVATLAATLAGAAAAAPRDGDLAPLQADRLGSWGPSEASPPPVRPGASLLLGTAPREVEFVLDGPEDPSFPLLTTFRDASIERWGPLRVYTNGRWGRWLGGAWWSYAWEPMLGPGDDALTAAEAAPGEPSAPHLQSSPQSSPQSPPLHAHADADPSMVPGPTGPWDDALLPGPGLAGMGWLRDRGWMAHALSPRARPLAPLFDTSGANLGSDGFGALFRLATPPPPDWRCRRRPLTIIRWGAESDSFALVRCDGSIPPGAHDRLSILARPPEVPWPGATLPDEPDPGAWAARREWLPDVRLVHPRLLWALQRIADDFPRRSVYVVSGYRPLARVGGGTTDDAGQGHRSLHADGRALDLHVQGVPNEEVFKACRALKDVGCGYYPSSKFVHVDVRRAHSGKAFWIDASAPGEPSRYVDSWPGVVDAGAMGWLAPEHRVAGP